MINRFILIILDSLGIGELPDAPSYGDSGSNTLGNLADRIGGLNLPNLQKAGLGNLIKIKGVNPASHPVAAIGKMAKASPGKDTTTAHWEIAGVVVRESPPLYPNGFPLEIIEPFKEKIGRGILGNKAASGTEIIEELGEIHLKTGFPIIYTSADSVFQIAAHLQVLSIEELYEMCRVARELLQGKHGVSRVIARPFEGEKGRFRRVNNLRRDFSLPPPKPTLLNALSEAGFEVIGIGKIGDIFAQSGLTSSITTGNNREGVEETIHVIKRGGRGLIFTNLIDFDMVYGHRNNSVGYARALEEFDFNLERIMNAMRDEDVLIITGDHGCDPTTESTDHSREYVPLLVYGSEVRGGYKLGVRGTLADVAATIRNVFKLKFQVEGKGFEEALL